MPFQNQKPKACQMLLRILYLRFRLWLLWKSANMRNAIGGWLLRCSARLAVLGAHEQQATKLPRAVAAILVFRLARWLAVMGDRIIVKRGE